VPDVPGLKADVYFGMTNSLPAWTGNVNDELDEAAEDRPLPPDERRALVAVLGFDPAELDDESSPPE
jgi:hypothetical protein